jgi:hypothetical protein
MRLLFCVAIVTLLSLGSLAPQARAQRATPEAKPASGHKTTWVPAQGHHKAASASTPESRVAGGALVGSLVAAALSAGTVGIAYAITGDDIPMLIAPGLATLVLSPLAASAGVLLSGRGQRFLKAPVFAMSYAFTVLSTLTTVGVFTAIAFASGGDPVFGPVLGLMASGVANTIAAPCAAYGGYGRGKRRLLAEQAATSARLSLVPHVGTLARERSYGLAVRYTF